MDGAAAPDPVARVVRALARPAPPSADADLNPGTPLLPPQTLRPAAVLLALWAGPRGMEVILTRRSSRLRHHPGQIAFPGGRCDAGDCNAAATALREAQEEVGLDPSAVELLGELPPHVTITGFRVTPVVGRVAGDFRPRPEAREVEEIFSVPLDHLLDLDRYRVERRRWLAQWRNYYVVPWGPYYIWGATARMLRGLAERMQE